VSVARFEDKYFSYKMDIMQNAMILPIGVSTISANNIPSIAAALNVRRQKF
jgi:hypothetical protein